MAELVACWKCHQPMHENARCKNCGATFGANRAQTILIWVIPAAIGLWLLFTNERALAFGVFLALAGYLIFGLGRNYEWWKQRH